MVTQWIEAGGIQLRYDYVEGSGQPVVLIHEMGGMLESWDAVAPLLPGAVLRYDQRGAGLSEKPPGSVTIERLAGDLMGLLDALAIEGPVALVGTAVGAAVAAAFAALHPKRAGALLMLAPAIDLSADRRAATLQRIEAIESGGIRATFAAVQSDAPDRFAALRLAADPVALGATWRMLVDLDITGMLAKIGCPTLVATAAHDRGRPPEYAAWVAGLIPDARLLSLDATHYMAMETPALVARTIISFLQECGIR